MTRRIEDVERELNSALGCIGGLRRERDEARDSDRESVEMYRRARARADSLSEAMDVLREVVAARTWVGIWSECDVHKYRWREEVARRRLEKAERRARAFLDGVTD